MREECSTCKWCGAEIYQDSVGWAHRKSDFVMCINHRKDSRVSIAPTLHNVFARIATPMEKGDYVKKFIEQLQK